MTIHNLLGCGRGSGGIGSVNQLQGTPHHFGFRGLHYDTGGLLGKNEEVVHLVFLRRIDGSARRAGIDSQPGAGVLDFPTHAPLDFRGCEIR